MADMPNDFWSGWIILLTVFSFIGLGWLVLSVFFLPAQSNDHKEGDEGEPVWDNDVREANNPIPLWWFWLLLSAMIFTAAYLMLYPGLGSFSGAFHWSQGGELEENMAGFTREFADINAEISRSSIAELQARPEVMKAARTMFSENCSACHGYEAQGQMSLFPNLRDDEWQWGNTPEQVEQTIRNGRVAAMISWQATLGEEGVENVADYVLTGLGREGADEHPGQRQYNQFCIACHGAAGQGNPLFGAPQLTNDIWLYGNSIEAVRTSISMGRTGHMPAFSPRLDDVQIKILVAWVLKQ